MDSQNKFNNPPQEPKLYALDHSFNLTPEKTLTAKERKNRVLETPSICAAESFG